MKILAIRVKNLASLEGETEIDFTKEPLKSAGIFAITGPMGAGKSTLLDALCLALFSKTPRHLNAKESGIELQDVANNKISQGDIRGILRKGCGDGYAEVDFVGSDGNDHKARWCVKRARNKIDGSLQSDTMELTNLTTNTLFPEKRKTEILREIERLVGLNFEQFTRSVLLAQGDFTAFLKADKDQKSSLLEKLTGTDIYSEISILIYDKFKLAELEFKDLQRQMEGITLLTAEELQQLNEQQSAIGNTITELEKENLSLIEEIHWHQALIELTTGKDQAEAAWAIFVKDKEAASERIKMFGLVEAVQGAKAIFDSKTTFINQLQQKSGEHQALLLAIQQLNDQHTIVLNKLTEADAVLQRNETESNDARPLIERAKELDTVIKEKNEQVKLAAKESADALKNKLEHATLIKGKQEELTTVSGQVDTITKWKLENVARRPIAENLQLIISKLGDAGKLLSNEKIYGLAIASANEKLQATANVIEVLGKDIDQKEKKVAALNASQLANEAALSAIAVDEIKATENLLTVAIDEMVPAKGCWEFLYSNQQEYDSVIAKLETCTNDILTKKETLVFQYAELNDALIRKEQSQKILLQAELQTAENVEDMRSRLAEGGPCPVCGSLHHPFTGGNPQLHQLLEGLSKEDLKCTDTYNALLINCGSLKDICAKLETDRIGFAKEAETRSVKINELTRKWQAFIIDTTCLSLPPAERLAWLDIELIRLKSSLKEIQGRLKAYHLLKENSAKQINDINQQEKELGVVKDGLKDAQRNQQTFTAEIVRLNEDLVKCNTNIEAITGELDPYFNNTGWCEKWQKDPVAFEQQIKKFAKDWREKMLSLESDTKTLGIIATELTGLQKQLQGLESVVAITGAKLASLQQSLSDIQVQRNQIFNGEAIVTVEEKIKEKIGIARNKLNDCRSEKEKLDAGLIKANSNKEQYNIDIAYFNEKIAECDQQIRAWINEYNSNNQPGLDENKVAGLLTYSTEWIAAERKSLTQLEDAITRAKATFEERGAQLSTHDKKRPSDRLLENLQARQVEVKALTGFSLDEKNGIKFQLMQDEANKLLLGNLQEVIQRKQGVYENWQKLNDLLGSADGKKFRQIAQEYTMDILLGYTNEQLKGLANRYKLSRVPNSLALQVLDRDMGDEIRSVHSLSGGESFLVSLALALGLASLSSNRMKVESLFIDEGFGSLDPATLTIAMNALENLHNQGRKVGVISHVQEMTERITTQIKISKISNGRSKVEVNNAIT